MLKRSITIFFFFLIITQLHAQDFTSDLEKMNQRYTETGTLKMKINISFMQQGTKYYEPYTKAEINKQDHQFRYTMGSTEMLMNKTMLLVADHNMHMITCRAIQDTEWKSLQQQYTTNGIDTLLKSYDSIVYKGINNGNKVYSLYLSNTALTRVDLYIDAEKYWLTAIEYKYASDPENNLAQVKVEFAIDEHPVFKPGYFDEKQFVLKQGNTWKAQQAYSGYQVYMNE